jgi:hypothetical protein
LHPYGAANWREDRDARHLDGIETIYVVLEPDRGGDTIQEWLSRSSIRHRATLICLPTKDASALHLEGQKEFARRWQDACLGATPWTAVEAKASAAQRTEAWEKCAALAQKGNILDEFTRELLDIGVVGEERAAKIIFLALVSRLLDRPVSVAVKGPSSGGKSFLVESTLKFFPAQAFYALTAMSEHALAYSKEPLRHRHLVIYEAAGMHSEFATYLGLLRARREWPSRRRAAEQRDELSPLHSITVSARTSSSGGIVRPSALAVLRLMTNCTFVG